MESEITATQVLNMLAKADRLSEDYYITEDRGEYRIVFTVDWYRGETGTYSKEEVIITKDNLTRWGTCHNFHSFMLELDKRLQEREQERIKQEKREALLERFTPEERELLGV